MPVFFFSEEEMIKTTGLDALVSSCLHIPSLSLSPCPSQSFSHKPLAYRPPWPSPPPSITCYPFKVFPFAARANAPDASPADICEAPHLLPSVLRRRDVGRIPHP